MTYLSAYVHLMCRQIEVDDSDQDAVNRLALEMLETINLSAEMAWHAMMKDSKGLKNASDRLQLAVKTLMNKHIHLRY